MSTPPGRGWLTGAAVVLGAMLVAVVAAVVAMVVGTFTRSPLSFEIPAGAVAGLSGTGGDLVAGAAIDPDGLVGVTVAEPTTAQSAWSALAALPTALTGLTVLALVLWLVLIARRGEAFSPRVVGTLRAVGIVAIVGGPATQLLTGLATSRLAGSVTGEIDFAPTLTFDWLIAGVCALALAEVVRRGQAIREELDEVI